MEKNKQKLPKWFEGELYTEGSVVTNPYSGEEAELTAEELSIYDFIKGAEYVMHAWAGAWICSAFRNEGAGLSSSLITSAVACTRQIWGEPPDMGMITFVDQTKVKPKANPGYCYLRAGFKSAGHTKGGLIALQLLPADMPQKAEPFGFQRRLL